MKLLKYVAFLFCLTSTIANAQPRELQKPILCDSLQNVITAVSKNFDEKPMWAGKDQKTQYVITFNEKTKSWSFIQFDDTMACILGTGEGGQLIFIPDSV